MDEKLKSENTQKTAFFSTSECTISQSNFQNFLRLRRQGGIDPPNQNPADVLASVT